MSKSKLPPLNSVRAFDAAARLGSYVAAAEALHVTQPAITRHVKILEDWLGVKLFQRTPRGVEMTPAGKLYLNATTRAFQVLAEGAKAVGDMRGERWIHIVCAPAFASRWLTPRLGALSRARPDLRISIEPVARITDLAIHGADLCIAYAMPDEFPYPYRLLAQPAVFPVCSPAYLDKAGPCSDIASLLDKDLVHVDDGEWWRMWFAAFGVEADVRAAMAYTSNDIALSIAEQGAGIALATELLIAEQLKSGALVRALDAAIPLEHYQAITHSASNHADIEWLVAWIGQQLQGPER